MAPLSSPLVARASGDSSGCPNSISSGGIAGIVIGSIAGTLLLLWLWRVCRLPGAMGGGEPDVGYRPPVTRSRGERRRRSRGSSYVDYVEKPVGSSRRYRDDVRRPAKVYLN